MALRIPIIRLLVAVLCAVTATASGAEVLDPADRGDATDRVVDPPGRVARLSFIDGPVSIAPADSDAWSKGFINRPLTSGDRIWVDSGGRAELDVGNAIIRLDQNTSFSFVELTDDALTARLNQGVIELNVLRADQAIAVTTPGAVVTLLQPGNYTIDAPGSQTIVKNYDGAADVSGGGGVSFGVGAGEQGVFDSTPSFTADIGPIGARSEFETWAYARDAASAAPLTSNYVAPDMVGYRDLDHYGTWTSTTEYGYVWQPSYVAYGWAPYRYGRWIWITPWGWTWVDDTPWGFAPFHYGRWVYLRSRWCWVPGPRYIRPVYAPALVGWIGDPYPGSVGWFPLAPREAYLPPCRTSWRYFRNVNIANTTIINTTYINQAYYGRAAPIDYRYKHTPRATTVVTRDAFASGRALPRHHQQQPPSQLHWLAQGRPPTIEPNRASRFGVRTDVRPPQRARGARSDGQRSDMRTPTNTAARTTDTSDFRTPNNHSTFRTPNNRSDFRTPNNRSDFRTPNESSFRRSGASEIHSAPSTAIRTSPSATTLGDGRMRTPLGRPATSPESRTPTVRPPTASRPPAVQRSWSGRRVDGISVDTGHHTTARPSPRAAAPEAHAAPRGLTTNRSALPHREAPPPRVPTSNTLRERVPTGRPPERAEHPPRNQTTPVPRENSDRGGTGQRPSFGVRQQPGTPHGFER